MIGSKRGRRHKLPESLTTLPLLEAPFKSLFNTYNRLNKNYPSSWFVWSSTTGNLKQHEAEICHASMKYAPPGFDNLVTACPRVDEISLNYQKMLIGGPFRSMSDLITLECVNEKYFIHASNLERWPANVLYNYCIATRIPIESRNLLDVWNDYVKLGYDRVLAFLIAYSGYNFWEQEFEKTRILQENGHFWLSPNSDWKSILSGTIITEAKSYFEKPSNGFPCNTIWGSSNNKLLINKTDEELAKHFGFPLIVEPKPRKPPGRRSAKLDAFIDDLVLNPVHEVAGLAPAPGHWNFNFAEIQQHVINNQIFNNIPLLQVAPQPEQPEDDEDMWFPDDGGEDDD